MSPAEARLKNHERLNRLLAGIFMINVPTYYPHPHRVAKPPALRRLLRSYLQSNTGTCFLSYQTCPPTHPATQSSRGWTCGSTTCKDSICIKRSVRYSNMKVDKEYNLLTGLNPLDPFLKGKLSSYPQSLDNS